MDFIEGIGERRLIGKANAVPQQLEGLVKNQLKGEKPNATTSSAGQDLARDREIEELRRQLAEIRTGQNGSQAHGHDKDSKVHSGKKGPVPAKLQQQAASVSGESTRSKHVSSNHRSEHHEHKKASKEPWRGRSDSIKTALAARSHSNSHQSHGRAQSSHSRTRAISPKGSVSHNEKTYSANHEIAFTTPVYQERYSQPPPSQHKRPERARSDPDICVVEVTEEEPRRQRRTNPGKVNFVEVLENNRGRTRYVVR
ncbi:MAG: hypothetical protein L6R37_008159 [Teloschistes peruensis]|nr:MAG: hypothetical protein L6R37_008159 [Teloschistes peruensis]